ncbi:MAG: threonylcarbamoyl-AMP synthase [Bifidobacteriaceae bacterium]|jgi:tRNA threonylcarbamoyl adenosine modification protein (Sua5/YciO/YrdC/YwlC family)|nr:threonylcarbamoyl-AMP synthase [Bifidobacteriaceae bacterium]
MLASVTPPPPHVLADAARAIGQGLLVVLPTDTVYGLAADPFQKAATSRLFAAKGRPKDLALPVLVADRAAARELVADWPEQAETLARAFWPGPLTIILPARPTPRLHLGSTSGTVGLRQPDHPATLALLRRTGPLAVSSANQSGQPPVLTAADAVQVFGPAVAVYVDGGQAPGPVASTVVDLTGREVRLVRAGPVSQDDLMAALPGRAGVAG